MDRYNNGRDNCGTTMGGNNNDRKPGMALHCGNNGWR